MRDILIGMLIGTLIGVFVGFYGENFVRPYAPYTFVSTLTLTQSENVTSYTVGQTITLKAELDTVIPSELSVFESVLRQFSLNEKHISLFVKEDISTYWILIETKNTFYTLKGEASFTYIFTSANTYIFKATFGGSNALKPSESLDITFTVM